MAQAKLHRQIMLGWIEDAIRGGHSLPDDEAICERFGFTSVESARTLLAELADAGAITIDWRASPRAITLGRKRAAFVPVARPTPSVVRADARKPATEQEAADRIRAILARGKAACDLHGERKDGRGQSAPPLAQQGVATPGNSQERPAGNVAKPRIGPAIAGRADRLSREDETVSPAPRIEAARDSEGEQPVAEQARDNSAPPLKITRLPTAPGRKLNPPAKVATRQERRQVNLHLSPEAFALLERRAEPGGMSATAVARAIVLQALGQEAEPTFTPGRKPFIRAAVIRAARRDDMDLDRFVTMLIERGFASYEADATAERQNLSENRQPSSGALAA